MEFLSELAGINIPVLIALIGITEFIKKQDTQNKMKAFYGYFFMIFCIIFGFIQEVEWRKALVSGLILHFGTGSLAYQYILRRFKNAISQDNKEG